MLSENTKDKTVYDALKEWGVTAEHGFYSFAGLASILELPPSKATSHAIGRAADKMCFKRHAGLGGRGIIVSAAHAAPAVSTELAEQMQLLNDRMNLLADQLAELAFSFEDVKRSANSRQSTRLIKLGKGIKLAIESTGATLQGVMTLGEVAAACAIAPDNEIAISRLRGELQEMRCMNDAGVFDFGHQVFGGFAVPPATTADDIEKEQPVQEHRPTTIEDREELEIKAWISEHSDKLMDSMTAGEIAIAVEKPRASERIRKVLERLQWPSWERNGDIVFEF